MAVAFAAVTTTLVLDGSIAISTNRKDYAIYFSKSMINSEDVSKKTISTNGQALTFDVEMHELGQSKELDYEVTNASKNYDARVNVECELEDITEEKTGLNVDDYLDVVYSNMDDVIPARTTANGKITMTLKRSMVEDMKLGLNCNLSFDAVERDNLGTTPVENESSNYNFSGYLVDKNNDPLSNIQLVILDSEKKYITTGDEAELVIEGLDMGFHEIYIIEGKTIDEIKKMSDEEIKNNSLTHTTFTQSSKEMVFENGYKIVTELIKRKYTITFDAQGGSVTPKTKTVINSETYGELPIPALMGYNFAGWYTNTEYTDEIKANTKVDLKDNQTLYAKWEANSITINFNSDGGNTITTKTVKYNSDYGELEIPIKRGYSFLGWYLNNTLITSTTKVTSTSDITLIAKWNVKKKTITINIDGTPTEVEIDLSKPIKESLPTPEKEGYEFVGWYKDDDTKLEDDKYLEEGEKINIHTKYEAKKYTVTFNGNTGSVSPSSKEVTFDEKYGELPTPTRTGYNFIGWFTNKISGTQVTKDTIVKLTANQTLYAHWGAKTDITYTVKHWQQNIGANDVPKNEENYTLIDTESLKGTTNASATPDTKNYTGFTSPTKESVTVLGDGSAEINYYYTRNSYTLTVNKDAGVSTVTNKTSYQYGENVNVSYAIKDGYTFKEITGDKTTNTFTMPASNVNISINTIENTYTITYELNGGNVSGENPTSYKVTSNDITLNNPTRTGYTFTGWTGSNGDTKEKNLTIATGSIGNRNYVANWNPNTYTVSFDSNGGNYITTVLTVTYNSTFGNTLPTPTRNGYTFDGWYTETTGGDKITSTTKVDITENKTLYAHWNSIPTLMVKSNSKAFWQYKTNIAKVVFEPTISEKSGYAYKFDVSKNQDSSVMSYLVANEDDASKYTLYIQANGKIMANPNSSYLFSDFFSLKTIEGLEYLDTSKVTNMNSMFSDCSSLTSLDLSNFDTSKVTSMSNMFYNCNKLTSLDISNFSTSKVTDMGRMFSECNKLTSLDLSNFDTSNVTNMFAMFHNCSSLTSLDLSNFNTSRVTDMRSMFHNCSKLTSLDLSNFDTSKVTSMNDMFFYCSNLTNLDVSNFNTSNVTSMNAMFHNCSKLTSLDLSNFDTSKVTNMNSMFSDCSYLTNLDVSNFDTSNVTDMGRMFYNCSKLTSLDVSNFDTSNVTNMGRMFSGCNKLTSLDLSNFDTSKVTDMVAMFYNCSSLTSLDLSNFNTSKVTNMNSMFKSCSNLTSLDVSNFDISKVQANGSKEIFISMPSNATVYVKDEYTRSWILTSYNKAPLSWSTSNVIIKE